MKSKKLGIILGAAGALLVVVLAVGIFVAKSKVSPKELRKLTLHSLKQTFPRADIELGKIEMSLGLSVSLSLDKLQMSTKMSARGGRKSVPLAAVSNARVNIPIWSILTGGGTAEIVLRSPRVAYHEKARTNNWVYAMGGAKKKPARDQGVAKEVAKKGEAKKKGSVELPSFLEGAAVNVKILDVEVEYALANKTKGEVKLSKFLVKNLNFKTSTAFELASHFELEPAPKTKVSLDALVIGQFKLAEVLGGEDFSSVIMVKLDNVKVSGVPTKIPDTKTDLNVTVKKAGDLVGDATVSFLNNNKVHTKFAVTKKGVNVTGIDINLLLSDLLDIGGTKVPDLSVGKSRFTLKGEVKLSAKGKVYPSVKFGLTDPVVYKHALDSVENSFSGSYSQTRYEIKTVSKLLEGSVNVSLKGKFDPNQKKIVIPKLPPYKVVVEVANLNLAKKKLQAFLYPPGKKEEKKSVAANKKGEKKAAPLKKRDPLPLLPPGSLVLALKHIKIGKEDLTGNAKFLVRPQSVQTQKFDFRFSEGKGNLTHKSSFARSGKIGTIFSFSMKNLNLSSFDALLPPNLKQITGRFTGKVGGSADLLANGGMADNVLVNVRTVKGELKGIDLSEIVSAAASKVPGVGDKAKGKKIDVDQNFEVLVLKGRFKHKDYHIQKFHFEGLAKKVDIKANGHIYPIGDRLPRPGDKDAKLFVEYQDNTGYISKHLQKHAGTKVLPMKLKGKGFGLTPDYGYTVKKLAKGTAKKKGKKVAKKVAKKAAKKLLDKAPGKLKDKLKDNKSVKKLLKGFF